jgi:single-strand DNA-binding protein
MEPHQIHNSVVIEGTLTADPRFRTVGAKNTPLATFSIASHRSFRKNDTVVRETSFFDIETWAEIAQTVSRSAQKGQRVRIVGRLKQSRWTDDSGETQYRICITGDTVQVTPRLAPGNQAEK